MKALAIILSAAMVLAGSAGADAECSAISIPRDAPTLFCNEQLSELAVTAPCIIGTRSAVVMTDRRMTEPELKAWIAEYWELGGINAFELEVVHLINIERETEGLHPLAISPHLSMAARFHSQEQVDLGYFAHRSPVYGRATSRAAMFGHMNQQEGFYGVGENVHGGTLSPERVLQGWLNSPGHRRAVMCPSTMTIGVGAVRAGEQGGRTTAKFGP